MHVPVVQSVPRAVVTPTQVEFTTPVTTVPPSRGDAEGVWHTMARKARDKAKKALRPEISHTNTYLALGSSHPKEMENRLFSGNQDH